MNWLLCLLPVLMLRSGRAFKNGDVELKSKGKLLFSTGILADIQYAPVPDGFSFNGSPRYYRHSLEVAKSAAIDFEEGSVDLVLNLGDIVDGKCQNIESHGGVGFPEGADAGIEAVGHVVDALSPYKGKVVHTYGNHCLYNLDRESLQRILGVSFVKEESGELVGYSSIAHKGIRFIVVDSYDIALMGRCSRSSSKHREARKILSANNPNYPENANSPRGLEGLDKRFVAFNGGVGKTQLMWLRQTLAETRQNGEKAIILSHQPMMPGSSGSVCLIWNYDDVLSVLREYSDVVMASLSGHAHKGGYVRDKESGIHFRVLEAALESFPERTYSFLDIYENCLEIRGFGNCASAVYDFQHLFARKSPA